MNSKAIRNLVLVLYFLGALHSITFSQSVFDLSPEQSMCITGKGLGQDAAYNPFSDQKSIAVVENMSNRTFSVRVQFQGKIVEEIAVNSEIKKDIILEKGYEMYLDSEAVGKAKVTFKQAN